jgi:hypothetical protein
MNFNFPRLKNEQDFENIVRDYFKIRTGNINIQNYGRRGQKQFGIDSYGHDFNRSEFIAIQCKNFDENKSSSDVNSSIKEEIDKTKSLPFIDKIHTYYYVTASKQQSLVQNYVEDLNSSGSYSFSIVVIFWDELTSELQNKEYERVLYKFFSKSLSFQNIDLYLPKYNSVKETIKVNWDTIEEDVIEENLKDNIIKLGEINPLTSSKYNLTIGFVSKGISLNGKVDIEINMEEFYSGVPEENWDVLTKNLDSLCSVVNQVSDILSDRIIIFQRNTF